MVGGHEQPVFDAEHIIAVRHQEMPFEFAAGEVDPDKPLIGGEKSVIALHPQAVYRQILRHGLFDRREIHEPSVRRSV